MLRPWYAGVHDLCLARLGDAHRASSGLFDRQILDGTWQPTTPREALSSTAIALIGLARSGVDPAAIGVDVGRTIDALGDATVAADDIRSVGLTLWANAVNGGEVADGVLARLGCSLAQCEDLVDRLTTMELAWLVTGLAHELERDHDARVRAVLVVATDELVRRYLPASRLFTHAGSGAPRADRARANLPNFADEIYSVFALSALARQGTGAWDIPRAAAARLAVLQGPRGEWWWHYNARRSAVARQFSVYSVHQHGMAPMTLHAADDADDPRFDRAIVASVGWIDANQSGRSMHDTDAGTIWRSLDPSGGRLADALQKTAALAGLVAPSGRSPRLVLNRETRPYEWAWCLFAEATVCGPSRAGHLV